MWSGDGVRREVFFFPSGAERLYGYPANEITGQPIKTLLPIYELPACEDLLRAAKENSFACCESAERVRKDGVRIRVVLKRTAVREESGAVTGVLETASAAANSSNRVC